MPFPHSSITVQFADHLFWEALPRSRQSYLPCPPYIPDPPCTAFCHSLSACSWTSVALVSTSALLTTPKSLTVWITINCGKFFKRWEYQTCLLRNLYAGQEATVRVGYGTTDWFQIRKGERQGCILSSCLFNLYAEYNMQNAGLD